MKSIGFGIIGCGDVTEKKSGPAFQKINGSRLVAVMRRDEAKLRDYAARHGIARYSTDYLDILRDPEINAVYIATPPDMHCFYSLEAAKYGKAVYVEKPMALSVSECHEMIAACRNAGVPLFTAYYRRGQEKFRKAKELLESYAVGELRSFSYIYACPVPEADPKRVWLLDRKVAGGGLLYDIGSHMADIILYLLGNAEYASGISANLSGAYAVNDTHSAVMRFSSGVQGALQFSFCASERRDELVIYGSRGSLSLSVMEYGPLTLAAGGRREEFAFAPPEHVQQPFIEQVVRTLQGTGSLDATGEYGLRTQEILETIENSREYRRVCK